MNNPYPDIFRQIAYDDAQARFDIASFFPCATGSLWPPQDILIAEQGAVLPSLHEDDFGGVDFIIVVGDLVVEKGVHLYSAESGVYCLLVTGSVTADAWTSGDTEIFVEGDLTLRSHMHMPEPEYEQGVLSVGGQLRSPVIIFEAYNPELCASFECKQFVGCEDIGKLPEAFLKEGRRSRIGDVEALVAWLVSDADLPLDERRYFDWRAYLGRPSLSYDRENQVASFSGDWVSDNEQKMLERFGWQRLDTVRCIDISRVVLSQFPEMLLGCNEVEEINLRDCFSQLDALPDLSCFPKLKRLKLQGDCHNADHLNQPDAIRSLMRMDLPELDYLEITFWGEEVQYRNGQRKVIRQALAPDVLEGIARFKSLRGIELYGNGLTDIPAELLEMDSLRYISLVANDIAPKRVRQVAKRFEGRQMRLDDE